MVKIDNRRYTKLLTVYRKLFSLKADFEDDKDILLYFGTCSCSEKINCALAALDCIFQEVYYARLKN